MSVQGVLPVGAFKKCMWNIGNCCVGHRNKHRIRTYGRGSKYRTAGRYLRFMRRHPAQNSGDQS